MRRRAPQMFGKDLANISKFPTRRVKLFQISWRAFCGFSKGCKQSKRFSGVSMNRREPRGPSDGGRQRIMNFVFPKLISEIRREFSGALQGLPLLMAGLDPAIQTPLSLKNSVSTA